MLELRTEHPPTAPTQLSKHLIIAQRPQLLRAVAAAQNDQLSSVTLILEER